MKLHFSKMTILTWGILMLASEFAWPRNLPPEFKNLKTLTNVQVDLRYASTNNFMNKNVYGDFQETFLHKNAFEMLKKASVDLAKAHKGYKLIVFDALRPRSVQRVLFGFVKDTPEEKYVANPDKGGMHNYGFAVDLSIVDDKGKELDMGTPFDDFTELSQPQLEDKFLKSGALTEAQIKNRKLLRDVMHGAGFKVLDHEWWHFDALPQNEVRSNYQIVE